MAADTLGRALGRVPDTRTDAVRSADGRTVEWLRNSRRSTSTSRRTLRKSARYWRRYGGPSTRPHPGAGEKISYQIPTITLDGTALVHFSGWKSHIALYPIPPADEPLTAALEPYRSGKGTLKFPLTQPIPYALITRITHAFITARSTQE
ncbi:iron chaperone [Kribbella sp. NPDC054772]